MEWIGMLVGCRGILAESAKVVCRIPKLMALFTILTITTSSLLYLPMFLGNDYIRAMLIGLQWVYFFMIAAPWSFFASATVLASAVAYSGGKNLPLKELLLRTWRTWRRPLSTTAYTTLMCYFPLTFWFVHGSPHYDKNRAVTAYDAGWVTFLVLASVFYAYYLVMCVMGMVVSVLEEKSWVEAMRKGKELVKGREMEGFWLNIVFVLVSLMVYVGMRMVMNTREYESEAVPAVMRSMALSWFWALGLFGMVAYTIVYMKCKETGGEEIQVLKSMDGGEEATQPLISPDLA